MEKPLTYTSTATKTAVIITKITTQIKGRRRRDGIKSEMTTKTAGKRTTCITKMPRGDSRSVITEIVESSL